MAKNRTPAGGGPSKLVFAPPPPQRTEGQHGLSQRPGPHPPKPSTPHPAPRARRQAATPGPSPPTLSLECRPQEDITVCFLGLPRGRLPLFRFCTSFSCSLQTVTNQGPRPSSPPHGTPELPPPPTRQPGPRQPLVGFPGGRPRPTSAGPSHLHVTPLQLRRAKRSRRNASTPRERTGLRRSPPTARC